MISGCQIYVIAERSLPDCQARHLALASKKLEEILLGSEIAFQIVPRLMRSRTF
jgi:hypothetical protein